MKKTLLFISGLLLVGCESTINLTSVDYGTLFHDDNSKVWVVNKMTLNNSVVTPVDLYDKHLMIFYSSHNCDYIALKDITRKSPQRGFFGLDSKKRKLYIEFKDEKTWDFDIDYLTEDSILLVPTTKSDLNLSVQLKPLPELSSL